MSAPASTRVDAGARLFPEGDVARRVGRTFDLMRVAEEEIAAAKARCPRKRKTLNAAFRYLCPNELVAYPDALYRSHARELLGRVARGENLEPGTDAELLVMFCETSLKAPLASQFVHAYEVVFHRVFPEASHLADHVGREAWSGSTDEIIADARRRLARGRDCR